MVDLIDSMKVFNLSVLVCAILMHIGSPTEQFVRLWYICAGVCGESISSFGMSDFRILIAFN